MRKKGAPIFRVGVGLLLTTAFACASCGVLESKEGQKSGGTAPNTDVVEDPKDEPKDKPPAEIDDGPPDVEKPDTDNAPVETPGEPQVRVPCKAASTTPLATIADFLSFVNALPLPVTLRCILEALPRPLAMTATPSRLSVQPANGNASPRIFVFAGSTLVLALVPDGEGANVLEMSELVGGTFSIKGEIAMPVSARLTATAPFDRIKRLDGAAGTSCSACHFNETKLANRYGDVAYQSNPLRPQPTSVMSLTALRTLAAACAEATTPRCEVLKALIGKDPQEAVERLFPNSYPTLF